MQLQAVDENSSALLLATEPMRGPGRVAKMLRIARRVLQS